MPSKNTNGKSSGKKSATKKSTQSTLCFSSGKMGIKSKKKEVLVHSEVSADGKMIISKTTNEFTASRKRKPKDVEEQSKAIKLHKKEEDEDGDLEEEKGSQPLDEVIKMELDLNYSDVSKMKKLTDKSFDPIKDAPYKRYQHIPLSLIAFACQNIEE